MSTSVSNNGTTSYNDNATGQLSQSTYQSTQGSFSRSSLTTMQQSGTASTSFSEQGTYGNNDFSFSSLVYQQNQSGLQTLQRGGPQPVREFEELPPPG